MQRLKKLLPYWLSILIITGALLAWWQHWTIYDWWRLRGYSPPQEIVQLATDVTMKGNSRQLFYVYHPSLDEKDEFVAHCESAERTIVLGCFVPAKGIYIQDIDDPRLNGVQQVTAAHEMLHAAYERLDQDEKDRIGKLMQETYQNLNNKRISQTIDDYRKADADINNELHSILATEVRKLPAELEKYYSQYFSDRQKIVAYSERYEAAFTKRKNQVAAYDKQLESLKSKIDSLQASLDKQARELEADRKTLESQLASKNYSDYNAGVPVYNAAVNKYNSDVLTARNLIDEYNALVVKRNQVALEENELVKAIDSRPTTLQEQ